MHHDRAANRYDLHPIVRRYAYDRLTDKTAAHTRLRDHFATVETPTRFKTLDELAPLIELYHHTVNAAQYDAARTLFRDRINQATYYQFGAYQLRIELLRALFPDGEDKPPRLKEERAQGWTLNALANSYGMSGQPRRAVPLFEGHNGIYEKRGDKGNLAIGLGNVAQQQLVIGALRAAEANLSRRIALCREIEDEFNEAIGHRELGRVLAYRGEWEESAGELDEALRMFEKQQVVQSEGVVWAYRALRELLMERSPSPPTPSPAGRGGLAAARRALELADETARSLYPHERDYVRAHWLLGAAYLAEPGDHDNAERHLTESLSRCRAINMVDHEADILIDLARLRAAQGEFEEARRLAQEAVEITERCGYVLQGADAHLELAKLAMRRGDTAAALHHARLARTLATCDGEPYVYRVAYDEAGMLIEKLTR